MPGNKTKRKLQ